MLLKLSLRNIRRSARDYAIYFVTLLFGVAVFYAFNSISSQQILFDIESAADAAKKQQAAGKPPAPWRSPGGNVPSRSSRPWSAAPPSLGGTPARQKTSRSTHWDEPLYKESPLAAAKAFAFSQSASAISSSSRCVSSQPKQGSVMDLP